MRCLRRYQILTNLAESENYRKFTCENCHLTAVGFALLLHDLHVIVGALLLIQIICKKTWITGLFIHSNKAATARLVKLSTSVVIDLDKLFTPGLRELLVR